MDSFKLSILAADRVFFEGQCESLIVPNTDGFRGVLAHNSNMIGAIVPGELRFRPVGESEFRIASVSQGMMKVESNEVLILVDSCERPDEIDERRAALSEARAKEELLQKRSIQEYYTAQTSLARAITRLRVKKKYDKLDT